MYLIGFPANSYSTYTLQKMLIKTGHSSYEDINSYRTVFLVGPCWKHGEILLRGRKRLSCAEWVTTSIHWESTPLIYSCVGRKIKNVELRKISTNLESFVNSPANSLLSFGLFGMWVCFKLLDPYRKWIFWASHFKSFPLRQTHMPLTTISYIDNMGGFLCQVTSLKRLAHSWNMW